MEQKRQKVRLIQQRKLSELTDSEMKDLPDQIPLPLVIGTEVTGQLQGYFFILDAFFFFHFNMSNLRCIFKRWQQT